ncbi:hypothetical protein N2152v2_003053 [Parachlorella kessleri]
MLPAVWDSSIVLAKYFERWPLKVAGKRCLDSSAGCGLVGIALSKLGAAQVVATDLEPNLGLLRKNVEANDVMYIPEATPGLVKTLKDLSGGTDLFIAHGRNRQAERAEKKMRKRPWQEQASKNYPTGQPLQLINSNLRPSGEPILQLGPPHSERRKQLPTAAHIQQQLFTGYQAAGANRDKTQESPEAPKQASASATSGRAKARVPTTLHQDLNEAAASSICGARLTPAVENLLFCPYAATINPALGTKNRKTEHDLEEPSGEVRCIVAALESLKAELAKMPSTGRAMAATVEQQLDFHALLSDKLDSIHAGVSTFCSWFEQAVSRWIPALKGEERRQQLCIALLRDLAIQALSTQTVTPETPWLASLPGAGSTQGTELQQAVAQAHALMQQLGKHARRLSAVAELVEKACRTMRVEWGVVMSAVTHALAGEPPQAGHIPHGFFEKQLKEYFTQFGKVTKVRLSRSKKTARSRGYAFLEFQSAEVAKIAADAMDGYLFFGQKLVSRLLKPEECHEDLFKGANRVFTKVPWKKIEMERHNKERTPQEERLRVNKSIKKDRQRQQKIKEAGIDYKYEGLQAAAAAAAPGKAEKTTSEED